MRLIAFELRHGTKIPEQLRDVLTRFSAKLRFGWTIPPYLMPFDSFGIPVLGGIRDFVFDLDHIDEVAFPAFAASRGAMADRDVSEQPNTPALWENQFPIASLINGDLLTIDVASPAGPQPIRYFSDELDGLHGQLIAPDFIGFVTAYTRLGCAGGSQDEWVRFGTAEGARSYLDADSPGESAGWPGSRAIPMRAAPTIRRARSRP